MKYHYRVIHEDSPDERGIDVALLYLPGKFKVVSHRSLCVCPVRQSTTAPGGDPTRNVLYVKGMANVRDTLHLVICHWPSRWEGYLESQPGRGMAAGTVRRLVDSISGADPQARIMVSGDLNDELSDPSLSEILEVDWPEADPSAFRLYQTTVKRGRTGSPENGTMKYQGCWYEFDHVFVNGNLLNDSCLYVLPASKKVHDPDFLLEKDPGGTGRRPFRTYRGYTYHGGFSDHLPVYIDLHFGKCPERQGE
jgi:hypothetical protein